MFRRELCNTLENRLKEPRRFIQVLAGPRQVGKTTAVRQVLEGLNMPNGDHNIPAVFTSTEADGGITKTLKIRQIEPEFLNRMFAVGDV